MDALRKDPGEMFKEVKAASVVMGSSSTKAAVAGAAAVRRR
ncbi:hypothetical protein ACFQ9Q_15925 [Streptomyces virginiae]